MKRWLMIVLIGFCLYACKSVNVATPAPNATSKPAVDTMPQPDKIKDPSKP